MAKITDVQVTDNSEEVLKAFHDQVVLGRKAIAEEAEGYAKEDCPVDTGRLRDSISNDVDEDGRIAYIGTNVEYAPFVEYGDNATHKTGKAHFLRDAASTHGEHYRSIMQSALDA